MADTKSKTVEEPKATLPVGHPKAGYASPDLSYHEGTGIIPDEEKEWHEERNDARESELEDIAEGEDKVAKEEQARRDELAKIGKERARYLEEQKYGPTAGKLPGDASYEEPESTSSSKSSSSGTKSSSSSSSS